MPQKMTVKDQRIANDVMDRYYETHHIYKRKGVSVDLTKLKDNESVIYGDGKTYHFLLVEKESTPPTIPTEGLG